MITHRKKLVILTIVFFISSYFMLKFEDIKIFSSISSFFIIIIALPSYYYLIRHLGYKRGIIIIFILSIIPVLVEAFAVLTRFPYGGFEYGDRLGWLILGFVPPTISFAYLPILLGSLFVASRISRKYLKFCIATSVFNLLVDLVIDPAAVDIGFWTYENHGLYYGVPLSNFVGWLITGFIYATLFYFFSGFNSLPLPSGVAISLMWILSFWSAYLLLRKLYIPGLLGLMLLLYIVIEVMIKNR